MINMIDEVLETYDCILSHLKNMPGSRIEDIFPSHSIPGLKQEEAWLKRLATESVTKSLTTP